MDKLRELLNSNFARAQEMLQRTKRDLRLAQEAGSSKDLLESLMESIGCEDECIEMIPKSVCLDEEVD